MILLTVAPQIQIQIEDFGGSFAMPHYGHLRPLADYFNSNLIVSNFVVADLISNNSDVFFYDE
jgi:nicotinic acid mononucleotide adenylyltransferase